MGNYASVIEEQLKKPSKRLYGGSSKHGDDPNRRPNLGKVGTEMDLTHEQAQHLLRVAAYDKEQYDKQKNNGSNKAPQLWAFNKTNCTLYRFHHQGGQEWHGFPTEKKHLPQSIRDHWRETNVMTDLQYNKLP